MFPIISDFTTLGVQGSYGYSKKGEEEKNVDAEITQKAIISPPRLLAQLDISEVKDEKEQTISSVLVKKLRENGRLDADDTEKAWEIYLQNFESPPDITKALEEKGFVNPFLDPDGKIKAWTTEVIKGLTQDYDKMTAIYEAIKNRVIYINPFENLEKATKNVQTAINVFNSKEGDCNEMSYLFYVMARYAGLKPGIVIKWKKLRIMVNGLNIWAMGHAYNWVKIGKQGYFVDPTKTIKPLGKLKDEDKEASAQEIFATYHADNTDPKDMLKSKEEITKALEIDPNLVSVRLLLSITYFESGDDILFEKEMEEILKITPDDPDAHYLLGSYYFKKKDIAKAEQEFFKTIELDPEYIMAYFQIFKCCQEKDINCIVPALLNIIRIYPAASDIHSTLGSIFYRIRMYKEAELAIKRTLEINETPAAHIALGGIYAETSTLEEARNEILKGIRLIESQLFTSYILLGDTYDRLNKFEEAKEIIEKAIQLKPESAGAHFGLGSLYSKYGQFDGLKLKQAEKSIGRAIGIEPKFCAAYDLLQKVYGAEGKKISAEGSALRLKELVKNKECKDKEIVDELTYFQD